MHARTIRRPLIALTAAALLTAALAACGSTPHARSGFIPTSVQLAKSGELVSKWGGKLNPSTIAAVKLLPAATPYAGQYGDLSEVQLAEVRVALNEALAAEFKDFGSKTGTRTLVIHAAVTEIKPNKPLLNVAPQTQIIKRGYGYATCELYATDGDGGPIVAALMQTHDTQRLGTEKYSESGTAKKAAEESAKQFRKLIGG
ncbi:MAG: hypothetical protein RIT24_1721 [Planctomycetota bacterium]